MRHLMFIILFAALQCGCTRLRFVVDTAPTDEDLTESVVLEDQAGGWFSDKVAMIDVTGLIMDAPRPGFLTPGENPVARFSEGLRRAGKDPSVKALIIRINSPGGTVSASDVMYREVKYFKQTHHKPVVILMGDVAASGGYYLACSGDEIVALPTTVTGSIGVIIETFNFADGLSRIGIRADSITSGPNKAMGSPFEPMPKEHRELLQGLVNEFYDNFKSIVTTNRPGLTQENMGWVTDGRVVTGRRAAEVGLVDRLGDLRDAFAAAKARANISAATLVKYHRPIEHVVSPYATAPAAAGAGSQINLLQLNLQGAGMLESPGFYYLWDPAAW